MNDPGEVVFGLGAAPGAHPGTAVAVLDAAGRVTGWTPEARRLLGHGPAQVTGRPAAELLAEGEGSAREVLAAAVGSRRTRSARVRVRHRDGRVIPLDVRISPLSGRGADGAAWLVRADEPDETARSRWNAAVLEAILVRSPVAAVVWDPQLRYLWVNETLARENGIPSGLWPGRRIDDVLPGIVDTPPFEAVLREVLASGVPVLGYEYNRQTAGDSPHHKHTYSISFFRIDDADGVPMALAGMRADVTATRRARARLDLLSEASTRIGTTLDVLRTAQELADYAVPLLADFVTVDLSEAVPIGDEPLARLGSEAGRTAVFRRGAVASTHHGAESRWATGEAIYVPPSSPFIEALVTGRSVLQPVLDLSPGNWLDEDPARAEVIRATGMHSLMITPIRARGETLGVAAFIRHDTPAPFEEDDLLLAEELVARAALCLDNARRYASERTAALALQRNLLPRHLEGGGTLEVRSRYLPADVAHGVGGDWYDVIPLSGARTALVVGDVVGHGINAAAAMGRLRTAVRTLAELDPAPDELLTLLDRTVAQLNEEDPDADPGSTLGGTCLYAVYDPVLRTLDVARAGHPPPLLLDPTVGVSFPDVPAGLPLGLGPAVFETSRIELSEGSTVVLYTDGLIETRDHDIDFGIARVAGALTPPDGPLDDLCSAVCDTFSTRGPLADDATLLMARPRFLTPDQVATWDVPADPAAVGAARASAAGRLAAWGLPELVPATELIVGELLANAVLHGAAPIRLRLIRHTALVCEVSDAGPGQPRPRLAEPEDEDGRGLTLVARSSRRWGIRRTSEGKTVWSEQALPGS
ncbi:PAS domain S-box-containing protein [Actinacidiphila yanglinensis]|uniref:protein-serine/threonine phosphatase n=1 Tax=Actinacidiphila yanglinensis TaxID=310779 RepID=A0A1H6AXW2_9ACTN|nr:SpoIIE family protein phosphatase [Actinacidiphila yanglinensis]SEG53408.1 PAS domain S-box-containing protein [Actinacidiphila yanglinensis]